MRSHHHIWVQVLVTQIVLNDWRLDAAAHSALASLHRTIIHEIKGEMQTTVYTPCATCWGNQQGHWDIH